MLVVAIHAALIAVGIAWYQQWPAPGVAIPAILIDMAPSSASPPPPSLDVAPGPEMQKADEPEPLPPPPEPPTPVEPEQLLPTPPQPSPEVTAPPEPKTEPAKLVPEPKKPEPQKPAKKLERKPRETPAPQTSAAPAAERQGRAAASAAVGASAASAMPAYRDRLAAHLQRFKQYPAAARSAGAQGTAMLSFTVGRGGQVLRASLAGSSGHSELDAETLAMIRRAQPLPAFPPEMTQSSMSFTVPIRFAIR
jgi:protein TonB